MSSHLLIFLYFKVMYYVVLTCSKMSTEFVPSAQPKSATTKGFPSSPTTSELSLV